MEKSNKSMFSKISETINTAGTILGPILKKKNEIGELISLNDAIENNNLPSYYFKKSLNHGNGIVENLALGAMDVFMKPITDWVLSFFGIK